jgi:methyl-coenzyme M reductase subunit C
MSPGPRHVPKPVCEVTTELRDKGVNVGELILNGGDGTPADAPSILNGGDGTPADAPSGGGHGVAFGLEPGEIDIIGRHKLLIEHHGNVKAHFIYKVRFVLKKVNIPSIVLCQSPVTYEDFEAIGVSTRNKEGKTQGKVVGIVSGIVRREDVPQEKLNEIVSKVRMCLREIEQGKFTPSE